MQRKTGHLAGVMPQVIERIHQKTATTLSTVRTAHNQFAKGSVPVQRPSSMRSEKSLLRAPSFVSKSAFGTPCAMLDKLR